MVLLAFSLQDQVEKYGAYVGIAAFFGLAVLTLLYFAQAREVKRLREWAGRAPERAAELEQAVAEHAQEVAPRDPGAAVAARAPVQAARGRPPPPAANGAVKLKPAEVAALAFARAAGVHEPHEPHAASRCPPRRRRRRAEPTAGRATAASRAARPTAPASTARGSRRRRPRRPRAAPSRRRCPRAAPGRRRAAPPAPPPRRECNTARRRAHRGDRRARARRRRLRCSPACSAATTPSEAAARRTSSRRRRPTPRRHGRADADHDARADQGQRRWSVVFNGTAAARSRRAVPGPARRRRLPAGQPRRRHRAGRAAAPDVGRDVPPRGQARRRRPWPTRSGSRDVEQLDAPRSSADRQRAEDSWDVVAIVGADKSN